MATASSSKPPPTAAASTASASGGSIGAAGPSKSTTSTSRSTSSSAQQPQVSLLGTLPFHLVPTLLRRIETSLVTLPPTILCEKETVLARHDDETSGVRETGDNAWASVVKARKGVKLRVRETVRSESGQGEGEGEGEGEVVECTLCLPLPSLPERQYPRASVRPSYNVQVLSDTAIGMGACSQDPFAHAELGFDPDSRLDTDFVNGWKSLVSSIGWRPHFQLLRYGLTFWLNENLSRFSTTATPDPLNPVQTTKSTLSVYRIFTPDPTGYTDDWVTLDPVGATVIVELTCTVGGQIDQSFFNTYSTPSDAPTGAGGLHPNSTIEAAIDFADHVAKTLRGLVDLRREAYD